MSENRESYKAAAKTLIRLAASARIYFYFADEVGYKLQPENSFGRAKIYVSADPDGLFENEEVFRKNVFDEMLHEFSHYLVSSNRRHENYRINGETIWALEQEYRAQLTENHIKMLLGLKYRHGLRGTYLHDDDDRKAFKRAKEWWIEIGRYMVEAELGALGE